MKKMYILASIAAVTALSMVTATSAFAGAPETTDGFVCPILGGHAGDNGGTPSDVFVTLPGGDTTIIGPDVTVPTFATNDDGAGTPGGAHASPGDDGQTAICAGS